MQAEDAEPAALQEEAPSAATPLPDPVPETQEVSDAWTVARTSVEHLAEDDVQAPEAATHDVCTVHYCFM